MRPSAADPSTAASPGNRRKNLAVLLAVCSIGVSGCSKHSDAGGSATTVAAESTAATVEKKHATACGLVTAAEMSTILGGTVSAKPGSNERPPSQTECDYESPSGNESRSANGLPTGPYAEVEVDWGGGELKSFNSAAKLAGGAAPGSTGALKGLGESAYEVAGFQVFISTDGNLMMIRFLPGARDVISKARRIYTAAKARL